MPHNVVSSDLTTALNIVPGLRRRVLRGPSRAVEVVVVRPAMLPDVAPHLLVAGHGVHVLPVDRDVEVVQRVQPVERVGALGGSWKWRSWLTN